MCSRMIEKSLLLGVTLCLLLANTSEGQLFRRGIFRGRNVPQQQRQPQRTPQPAKSPTTIQPNTTNGAQSVQTANDAPKQISILQIIDENGNVIFPNRKVDSPQPDTEKEDPTANQQTTEKPNVAPTGKGDEPLADGMVRIRYPNAAAAELKFKINGVDGSLKPGSSLSIPAGKDFDFSYAADPNGQSVDFPTEKPGEFVFEQGEAGWRVAVFRSNALDSVKK